MVPRRWRSISVLDAVVLGVLLLWHVIGANTADDGYQLGMVRASEQAGYMVNYFRYFGVPETPFGTPRTSYGLRAMVTPPRSHARAGERRHQAGVARADQAEAGAGHQRRAA